MKKINFKKMFRGRNVAFTLLILAAVFLTGNFVFAGFGDWAGNVVGGIIALFIRAISSILILLVGVLMKVAAYSDFINAQAVVKGWVVVRDLCNMFFVIILLVIAFATILGQEEYGAKKMLPKLIMAAVLINFSKMICGLMIDVASVVMLTFVNAFSAIGAGNILDLLGITEVTQISVADESVSFATVVSAYIFGLLYVIIATVVVASMLGMLVIRIVYIWIYTVLSPLAFFLQAVPGKGQQYASKWWDEWTKNLLIGPVIAFFLWLSFAALQDTNPIQGSSESDAELASNNKNVGEVDPGLGSKAGTTSSMAKFVIAIGMLLGGMKIAQEVGGEAGKALGKGMSALNKGKSMALDAGKSMARNTGKAAATGALWAGGKTINSFSKRDENTGKKPGNKMGNFVMGWQADMAGDIKKRKKEAANKYMKNLGIGDKGKESFETLREDKTFQKVTSGAKNAAIGAALGFSGIGAGFALAPIMQLVTALGGAAVGGAGGVVGSGLRDENKANLKTAKTDYENKKTALGTAKSNLESDPDYAVFTEYEKSQKTVDTLSRKRNLSAAEQTNLNNSRNYVNDASNTAKYNNLKPQADNVKNLVNDVYSAKKSVGRKEFVDSITSPFETFKNTKEAIKDVTKKKKQAKDWVNGAANATDTIDTMKKGEIYSGAGLSENWKNRFEEMNKGDATSMQAIDSMVNEIGALAATGTNDDKLEAFAKAIAAFKGKDGDVNPGTLGKIEAALSASGFSPASFAGKVSTQYRQANSSYIEDVKDGSGSMQYDAFAKNSTKPTSERSQEKDIMGASFGKINDKAKELGVDYSLDAAAGVNQKIDGEKLSGLSKIMEALIDDEIKALEQTGVAANSANIAKLNAAKARFAAGDVSSMSLKNTDVVYKGETDSEKRRNEYNTTQHETMHQFGAENEEAVDYGASALQEAKLVGKVSGDPENSGKRYDEVLGGLIAKLEQAGASQETMAKAITDQVSKWQTPNAQRVVETEAGERETVTDVLGKKTETEQPEVNMEKVEQAINKMSDKLSGTKVSNGPQRVSATMSNEDRQFFIRHFESLKKKVEKSGNVLSGKISPLSAVAANKELDR
jgi:hypothetical protein